MVTINGTRTLFMAKVHQSSVSKLKTTREPIFDKEVGAKSLSSIIKDISKHMTHMSTIETVVTISSKF